MIGQTLAHYEILDRIGEGGMGEVFRARDSKLGREVALKLLPPEFATDRERLARFRREARTLAALNHPHIAAIHDIDEADGKVFLTMELVEGQDLAERLRSGPIRVEEAIGLATQLAEGLREAHGKHIVHRDLKPANIKVTPDGHLKILDFGLARAWHGDEESEENLQNSPTITAAVTHQGVILGTAAYMSPEQARGRVVDHRADIWAFGAILWEMLTARQLFEGESVSDTLAAVLRAEPDENQLPTETPRRIRELMRLCLDRDRKRRLQDIGDARLFLEPGVLALEGERPRAASDGSGRWRAAALAFAALAVAMATVALLPERGRIEDGGTARVRRWSFEISGPTGGQQLAPAISPDGDQIAVMNDAGLWVRALDELQPRLLEGTAGATNTFWSPDSRWIGFLQGRRLLRVARSGGQVNPIGAFGTGDQSPGGSGSSMVWDREGRIVVGTGSSGLLHIPNPGALAELFLPTQEGETDYHQVASIPGGRGWVFVVHANSGAYSRIDKYEPDGTRGVLLDLEETNVGELFVDPAGYLLFRRHGMNDGIWAAPFSVERAEVTGAPFLVAEGGSFPTVSTSGTLVYQVGGNEFRGELAWLDREGRTVNNLGPVATTRPFPFLGADGREFLMCVSEDSGRDIWRFEVETGLGRRVASTEIVEEIATWSPDGEYIYLYAAGESGFEIRRHPTNIPSESELVVPGIMPVPRPDLGGMFYAHQKLDSFDFDIAFVELGDGAPGEPQILVEGAGIQWFPSVSPDGRFLLYVSDESGQDEVYLTELPGARGRWKVSMDGGQWPKWRGDGGEIYFTYRDVIHAVDFDGASGVRLGAPRPLFTYVSTRWATQWDNGYEVDATGERFLVVRREEGEDTVRPRIVVVENWASEFGGK